MKNKTDSNNLLAYVKSLIRDIHLYLVNKNNLINNLVHAIVNERLIIVNGAAGTGKSYLVNEVIIPQLDKKYSVHRFNRSNLNSTELDTLAMVMIYEHWKYN